MNYFNYYVNEHDGCLCLFIGENKLIGTVSDCLGMPKAELDSLADEVLAQGGYIKEDEKYFQV